MYEKTDKGSQRRLQEYFDSLPDDPVGEGFDNFFVGDEAEVMMYDRRKVHNFQGMAYKDTIVEMEDDLDLFYNDYSLCNNEEAISIFYEVKSDIFSKFDFIKTKSRDLDYPVREEDLIVTEDDYHLISYLVTLNIGSQDIRSIAAFSAFREMGVLIVRFSAKCGCPVCHAFNGTVFSVPGSLEDLCSGRTLVHRGCECEWIPIFDRKSGYKYKIDEEEWGNFHKVPIELMKCMKEMFVDQGVIFEDTNDIAKGGGVDTSAGFPVVFMQESGLLCVHNGYINGLGPVDFLRKYIEEDEGPESSVEEVFLYKGRTVYFKEGLYYDTETGEVI